MEWISLILGIVSALFSLGAVIASIYVPKYYYRKEQEDRRRELKDELDAMKEATSFPFGATDCERRARQFFLEKQLGRK